ncbi:MAG: acetylxylan esterase [Candidatus Pseudobacter hemicellulosilyticus]|uniref:Acetylxylan esterase n=1 Tax=Candidatus Pseudobacter hemicellulosilyticus TaxID=3121375 RepID=A0AAJ5WQH9_9BACT|nr:MAG: acetylxylan esterase [Pseudobacter sp.]
MLLQRSVLILFSVLCTGILAQAQESDPFAPYLTGKPPVIEEDLGTEMVSDSIRVHKFLFRSRVVQTPEGPVPTIVYAAIAYPSGKGPFPGMLRLHGGGGSADIPAAVSSARAGYASIVLDVPGIAAAQKRHPKTAGTWTKSTMITANPDASNSSLFDAVLGSIQAFYLLRAQPGVDASRMCVAGASWGGYTATMVAALIDKDIKATWSVFGSGHFELGAYEKDRIGKLPDTERARFQRWLDPGRRAQQITKPYFISTASNDRHWSWMAVQATTDLMRGPVNQFYSPNDNHAINYPGAKYMLRYFDHYVKGIGPVLPQVLDEKTRRLKDGRVALSFTATGLTKLAKAEIWYAPADTGWITKKWLSIPSSFDGKRYISYLPAAVAAQSFNWYAIVSSTNPAALGKDTIAVSGKVEEVAGTQAEAPVVFNAGETAGPGDVFGLQGAFFGAVPQVLYQVLTGQETALKPASALKLVSVSDRNITAQLPLNGMDKGQLIAIWVKNGPLFSQPVFLNRARAVSIEFDELMPGQDFRIFGRNLWVEGQPAAVLLQPVKGGQPLHCTVQGGDAYILQCKAPAAIRKGVAYRIIVSNGAGKAWGQSTADEIVSGRAAAADPFNLKVPWGADFWFAQNIYNVRTDVRLKLRAAGDGLADDRAAIQQAIDLAHKNGGGVIYLPAGKYRLEIPSGAGLTMRSRTVLKGDGPDATILQYGFGTPPPYPNPIGKGGWPDSTTEGVAILYPLGTTLTGLCQLQVQNVNTSGQWRHSIKNFRPAIHQPGGAGSKFFAKDCKFDLALAWGLSWSYVDRMVISDCWFDSKASVTWPWMWHCNGSTNFVVRNNTFRYSAGRFGFNESYNGIIENNHITRYGDLQAPKGETGGFNIDYADDIVMLNNRFDVQGRAIEYHNQGETILSQGGDPLNMSMGKVSAATAISITDTSKNWGPIRTLTLSTCDVVAIVDGRGAGQWRRIVKNTANTVTVDKPWTVIPDKTSHYAFQNWSAEDWLVRGNVLEGNNRGIWFYCGGTDITIVENRLSNSEGIYLRADQRMAQGRYNLTWNFVVNDNIVINDNGLRPAFVCNTLALVSPDSLHGIGTLGVEIRRNYVQASTPNAKSFVPGEGYWNLVDSKKPITGKATGILGTIFDQNKVSNADTGYLLRNNIDQTIIKEPVYRNVKINTSPGAKPVFLGSPDADQDPLARWLDGKAPRIIKELGDSTSDGISMRRLLFHSREITTDKGPVPTEVFAILVRPAASGQYPGLLLLHGGGGNAAGELPKAISWAKQGYIVMILDEPGIADPKKAPASNGHWKSFPYGQQRFTALPDLTHSTIFDGVLSCVQALYLLHEQPNVLKDRIGVTGVSWGGYMTTMLAGLAPAYVHAAFSTYGCGFYDTQSTFLKELQAMPEEQRSVWLRYLDAGRRAKNMAAPYFVAAAANDNWFYPPAVMATLAAVNAPANHFFAPNANHSAPIPGGNGNKERTGTMDMELLYFNYYLKGQGQPLPLISGECAGAITDAELAVQFYAAGPAQPLHARVFYSTDTVWTKRQWQERPATAIAGKPGWYQAQLPIAAKKPGSWWYPMVSDERPVSVSGKMIAFQ